jgi:hypothetical protein
VNLKNKVDAWLNGMDFSPGGMCEVEFRNLLADIFNEMDQRADNNVDWRYTRKATEKLRTELNIPLNP